MPLVATFAGLSARGEGLFSPSSATVIGSHVYNIPGTYTWTCPTGVTLISYVSIGGGAGAGNTNAIGGGYSLFASTSQANGGANTSSGAGGSGNAGSGGAGGYNIAGGGAGGYSGNGGAGSGASGTGSNGSGGAGGGGNGNVYSYVFIKRTYYVGAGAGGGTGIYGAGSSGTGGGSPCAGGGNGSGGSDGQPGYGVASPSLGGGGNGGSYGGGGGGNINTYGGGGGGLSYGTQSVTPGNTYTVVVGIGGSTNVSNGGSGSGGAVRIVWPGATRYYPSTNVSTTTNEVFN